MVYGEVIVHASFAKLLSHRCPYIVILVSKQSYAGRGPEINVHMHRSLYIVPVSVTMKSCAGDDRKCRRNVKIVTVGSQFLKQFAQIHMIMVENGLEISRNGASAIVVAKSRKSRLTR